VPLEDFVRARSAALFRTALLLTGHDRPEAEDLLQGALERAYRRWGQICRLGIPSATCASAWSTRRPTCGVAWAVGRSTRCRPGGPGW
jgi:DNA-directed RNA polymerase specialized sigma24 family protein